MKNKIFPNLDMKKKVTVMHGNLTIFVWNALAA